jgi:hypothetical protein
MPQSTPGSIVAAAPEAAWLTSAAPSAAEIDRRFAEVREATLRQSRHIDRGDFDEIGNDDLCLLFSLYDRLSFDGLLARLIGRRAGGRIGFRLSRRMTSSGGTTTLRRHRALGGPPGGGTPVETYEIAVGTTLLFQTFRDRGRDGGDGVRVDGLLCRDRLDALLRVFEHELIHLAELLVWDRSNCAAARFRGLAGRLFGHTDVRHELVTHVQHARAAHGVHVGQRVLFDCEGQTHCGVVNRVTRRATVLVERADGVPYSDGRRYAKYYVPLDLLRPAEAQGR